MVLRICISVFALMAAGIVHAQPKNPLLGPDPMSQRLPANSVPPVTEWRGDDTEGKVTARTVAALAAGPDAMEELGRHLLNKEPKDGDGRYTMPYFYREVAAPRGKPYGDMGGMKEISGMIGEWRKKYPASPVAMVAEAASLNREALRMIGDSGEAPTLEENYKRVADLCARSLALLEKAKELESKDAGWHVTKLVAIRVTDHNREPFEKAVDGVLRHFPDSGYILSRAVMHVRPEWAGDRLAWEPWLRGKLAVLPPDMAAKAYVRTIAELSISAGQSASTTLTGVVPDLGMIRRGWEAWAKEYPSSIGLASEQAALAAWGIHDPVAIQSALRRANGKLDGMFTDKASYESLIYHMTSIPWDPKQVGLPDIKSFIRENTPLKERVKEAAAGGPKALEELAKHLHTVEQRDGDGAYNSFVFYLWFHQDMPHLTQVRESMERQKLLEAWEKEFPSSPFAKLASAHHWVARAWAARSANSASGVPDSRWEGFRYGLLKASEYLKQSRELRETEPAWFTAAVQLMTGSGEMDLGSEQFKSLAAPMFRNFPESRECHLFLTWATAPRWGGEAGEWEPFLREGLASLPEDARARAYASAVISTEGYAMRYPEQRKERYGNIKPDKALVRKGLESLRGKYPKSSYFANAEAMWFSGYDENAERAFDAMQRLNGKLDLRVWEDYDNYHRCVRWVTWKMYK